MGTRSQIWEEENIFKKKNLISETAGSRKTNKKNWNAINESYKHNLV